MNYFFSLILRSVTTFVGHIASSFFYFLPTLVLLSLTAFYILGDLPILDLRALDIHRLYVDGTLIFLFLYTNTLYVYASCQHIVKGHHDVLFKNWFAWEKHHGDFLLFVGLGFTLLTLLTIFFLDFIQFLIALGERLERARDLSAASGLPQTDVGQLTILLFGSEIAAAVFVVISVFMWQFSCRVGLRIPAYTNGFYVRAEEALQLTGAHSKSIFLTSLFFIIGASSLIKICTNAFVGTDTTASLPIVVTAVITYFITSQLHIAMWVSIYRDLPPKYPLNPVVI